MLLLGNTIVQHSLCSITFLPVLHQSESAPTRWSTAQLTFLCWHIRKNIWHLSRQQSFFKMSCFNSITGKELRGNVKPKSSSLCRSSAHPGQKSEHTLWHRLEYEAAHQNGTTAELGEWTTESTSHLNQEPIKKEKSLLQSKAYKYRPFRTSLLVNHHYKI